MSQPIEPAPVAHAEALGHTVAELLRFAREGAETPHFPFGLEDITVILAEALLFALRIEVEALRGTPGPFDEAEIERGGQLCAALAVWLTDSK